MRLGPQSGVATLADVSGPVLVVEPANPVSASEMARLREFVVRVSRRFEERRSGEYDVHVSAERLGVAGMVRAEDSRPFLVSVSCICGSGRACSMRRIVAADLDADQASQSGTPARPPARPASARPIPARTSRTAWSTGCGDESTRASARRTPVADNPAGCTRTVAPATQGPCVGSPKPDPPEPLCANRAPASTSTHKPGRRPLVPDSKRQPASPLICLRRPPSQGREMHRSRAPNPVPT